MHCFQPMFMSFIQHPCLISIFKRCFRCYVVYLFARCIQKKIILTLHQQYVLSNTCNILFPFACILIKQVFICTHIFMSMYNFVPPFREETFCAVASGVSDKSVCAASKKKWLRKTATDRVCTCNDEKINLCP
jgi:hypothetical protein